MNTLAIIIACGKEEQITKGTDTAFLTIGSRPVLALSLQTFQKASCVNGIIVVVSKDRVDSALQVANRFGCTKVCGIVTGSSQRLTSLRAVLAKLPESANTILIHEASRPFVSEKTIEACVRATKRYGCAIAAHCIPDAVKLANGLTVKKTLERHAVWQAQTPQGFKTALLEKLVDSKNKNIKVIDDESEWIKKPAETHLVESGGDQNMKIRTAEDLLKATAFFHAQNS
jgi:2-C-methyl-D-erythritol 4-phosphate cytidylyltransferase